VNAFRLIAGYWRDIKSDRSRAVESISNELAAAFRLHCVFILLLGACTSQALALEFRSHYHEPDRIRVLIAEGEIESGDDRRFLMAVGNADRDSEGHVVLVLNSLGGSVDAAFKLVEAMDKVGVFTLVPDDALCASACASIVYVGGARRNIVGTGKLGFHSCYVLQDGKPHESSLCNERVAQNAFERGLAHASVDLFTQHFGARDMAWVGREVACKMLPGSCRPRGDRRQVTVARPRGPSFDCTAARGYVEQTICREPGLASLDFEMSQLYESARRRDATALDVQRKWLRTVRSACTTLECLDKAYRTRIRELQNAK